MNGIFKIYFIAVEKFIYNGTLKKKKKKRLINDINICFTLVFRLTLLTNLCIDNCYVDFTQALKCNFRKLYSAYLFVENDTLLH